MSRGWAALAWTVGGLALYAVLLRIALTENVSSDPANNVLQAWDLAHGYDEVPEPAKANSGILTTVQPLHA